MFEKLLQGVPWDPDETDPLSITMDMVVVLDAIVKATAVLAIARPADLSPAKAFEAFRTLVEDQFDFTAAPEGKEQEIRDLLEKRLAAIEGSILG